jgi:hypothetical protein
MALSSGLVEWSASAGIDKIDVVPMIAKNEDEKEKKQPVWGDSAVYCSYCKTAMFTHADYVSDDDNVIIEDPYKHFCSDECLDDYCEQMIDNEDNDVEFILEDGDDSMDDTETADDYDDEPHVIVFN